jgi:hypothetical protein
LAHTSPKMSDLVIAVGSAIKKDVPLFALFEKWAFPLPAPSSFSSPFLKFLLRSG